MPPAVVLVTGVSRWLGGALAAELAADPAIERIIGVDTVPPSQDMLRRLGRTEFVRADIRNPLIGKVIASASVDTVVHMNISSTPANSGGRGAMKELNVIGTMQLLAACQRAPSVRRVVLKSTSAVYGASPRDPAVFTEAMQARRVPSGGFARDSVDIEGYMRSFARRRPDADVVVLRFTNFIGPRIDSLLTGFFRMPVVPTALGYDARVQLLHEDDALAVLVRATTGDFAGTVNVGGEGTLLLSQAIRRLGRVQVPVPTPALGGVGRVSRR
ncbi:MAG: galE2, partial [Frankiales bacterium]|nr:galE2 [Frankiales bacterium]